MTIHTGCAKLSAAATLAAAALVGAITAANARPSGDPVADARAAVLRILDDRASPLGFADIVQRPFAVCGWVHVRNSTGEDGRRQFVYSLVSLQVHILDPAAYPERARVTLARIRHYCA